MIPDNHPAIPAPRVGVLLVNLGTPDAPTPAAVRTYLREFLSDRRVVEIPAIVWQPILRGVILNTRPRKSAKNYAKVWTDEGSPLLAITRRQAAALAARMPDVVVDHAMRYGTPSIADRLGALHAAGCTRLLIAPLYPQYCGATTATVVDAVGDALAAMRWQPTVRFLPPYYADDAYIDALAATTGAALSALSFAPDAVIASFHGMPQRTLDLSDPYHCHCQVTARRLSTALGRPLEVAFQSRFGRAKWLEPSTEATIARLAAAGVKRLAIVAPGFSADCLETLEELAMQGREQFLSLGGTDFAYLPCLNDSAPGMAMLDHLIARELMGWRETA